MITITLNNKTDKKISELLKDEWVKEDEENKYTYDFEVIARYIDLALQEEK